MLDRREFLKLGAVLTVVGLTGCNETKHEKHTMLSSVGVQNYEMIFCDTEVMMVRYEPLEKAYLTVNKLEVREDGLEEREIYKEMVNTYDDIKGNFYELFNVQRTSPAFEEFENHCGKKDYYTIEDISYVLDSLEKENINNRQKTLVK